MKSNIFLATLMGAGLLPIKKQEPEDKRKTCLVCNNQHTHNNSFCSPKCCSDFYKGNNK